MRAKVSRLIILILAICAFAKLGAQNNNIIKDPGFEQSIPGELKNWKGFLWAINGTYPGKAQVIADKEKARNGEKFLRMEFEKSPGTKNNFMIVFDTFGYPVYENKKYTLKLAARGEGDIGIGFQRYDKAGKWIQWMPGQSSGYVHLENTDGWKEISWSYVPENKTASIRCNISVKGKIDVDDVFLGVEDCTEEEIKLQKEKNNPGTGNPGINTSDKAKITPPGENDILNGKFEKWHALKNIPSEWYIPSKSLPDGWCIENRKTEKGSLQKIENPGNLKQLLGEYSILLDGRIVSSYIYDNLKNKKFRISIMAKGKGGNLLVRLREYMGPPQNMVANHIMEIIDANTEENWKKYTTEVTLPGLGGPLPCGASIEIIGKNVVIANLKSELLHEKKEYVPIIYSIPVSHEKINIDGNFSDEEWQNASGTNTGFLNNSANLVKRQSDFYLSSDGENLLICLRAATPGKLKKQALKRDGDVWADDSYEIHINPTPGKKKAPVAYQFVINAAGTVFDQKILNGVQLPANKEWNCNGLKLVSKDLNNIWTLEISIPLREVGLEPETEFGFNICRNLLNPVESSNLTGSGYFDYDKMLLCRIRKNCPSFFWGKTGPVGEDNLSLFAANTNFTGEKQTLDITFSADTENFTKEEKFDLALPAKSHKPVNFNTSKKTGDFGNFGVNAIQNSNNTTLVSHKVNFEKSAILEQKKNEDEILFYPIQKKIGVLFKNVNENFAHNKPEKVEISISGENSLLRKITAGKIDIAENNGYAMANFAPLDAGSYLVTAEVFDKKGNCMEHLADYIEIKNFPWMNNTIGKGKEILKPFIPMTRKDNEISCWGRKYVFSGSGLPEQIISQNEKVLNAPISFVLQKDGKAEQGKIGSLKIRDASEQSVSFTGESIFSDFKIVTDGKIEYDGTILYTFDIIPEHETVISGLCFEIPFRNLKYFHAPAGVKEALWMSSYPEENEYIDNSVPVWNPDCMYIPKGARKHNSLYFPKGNGLIWSSKNVLSQKIQGDFLSYLTLGNPVYGLCWFANNDRGWNTDSKYPSYEIIREGTTSKIKINLITKPLDLKTTRKISFALAATPMRKKITGFNYFNYSVMGFGESSFIDGYGGGLTVKDEMLLDKYISSVDADGKKPVFFYVCKSYIPLGDKVSKYFYNEWHTTPEEYYHNRNNIPSKKYGLNPDNYFAPAACLYPERIDYMASKIDVLAKNNPKLRGIYWDENYSVPCLDISHKNCGYIREDGKIQAGLHLYEMRELDKRTEAIFQKYNKPFPNLLVHSTAMIPPVYSFADINLCAERGTRGLDFIDYWDLPRVENTGAGAWGINIMWIPQWGSAHGGSENTLRNNRSMLAVLKLFDFNIWQIWCIPNFLQKFRDTEIKFGVNAEDSLFYGYWQKENKEAVSGIPNYIKTSFFVRPGKGALLYVSNFKKEKLNIPLHLNFEKWNIGKFKIIDVETDKEIKISENTLNLEIEGHDFRALLIENIN